MNLQDLYQPDLSIGFIWVVALTWFLLVRTQNREMVSRGTYVLVAVLLLVPLAVQGVISYQGYYKDFSTMPPRVTYALGPSALIVLFVVFFRRRWLDCLSLKKLTWLHVVRVFVEIILMGLYLEKQIPKQMTFAGDNFDIIAGLTAPVAAWTLIRSGKVRRTALVIWNVAGLLLLCNIVVIAVLSAPTPFQQLNFSHPNVAVGFFPFTWLPAFVVPAVLFCHLASLRILLRRPVKT